MATKFAAAQQVVPIPAVVAAVATQVATIEDYTEVVQANSQPAFL